MPRTKNNVAHKKKKAPKVQIEKEKKQHCSQIINVCFTLNNYTLEEELELLCFGLPITYMIFGYEKGEKEETPHLQGYLELNHRMRLDTIKKIPGLARAHLEARRGTQEEAINYCKKDGNFLEWGDPKINMKGHRFDLDEVRVAATNFGMREVVKWGNLQQIRVAEKYLQYCEPRRNWEPEVTWIYGPTGTGKSRIAHERMPNAYRKGTSNKWWDGYDGHEDVIMDDFRGNWMTLTDFLDLTDRYGTSIEYKGGTRQFLAKRIIITSAYHPEEVYHGSDEKMEQLTRRIKEIIYLGPVTEVGGNTERPDPHTLDFQ